MLYSTGGLGVADDTVDRSLGGVSSAIGDGGLNWSSSKISHGMLLVKKIHTKNTKLNTNQAKSNIFQNIDYI